jgi:hypothetical protein
VRPLPSPEQDTGSAPGRGQRTKKQNRLNVDSSPEADGVQDSDVDPEEDPESAVDAEDTNQDGAGVSTAKTPALSAEKTPPQPSSDLAGTSGKANKRSHLSGRDVKLGKAVASQRMEVAVKIATMREQAAKNVLRMELAAKREMTEQQIKAIDRATSVQQSAVDVQKAAVEMQKSAVDVERERYKSNELMEVTRMYVASGKEPDGAMKLAKQVVFWR